jgi:hypothetical protein
MPKVGLVFAADPAAEDYGIEAYNDRLHEAHARGEITWKKGRRLLERAILRAHEAARIAMIETLTPDDFRRALER